MAEYFLLVLVSFFASFLLTPLVRASARRFEALDRPADRKIHRVPVPRLGGVSVVLSVFGTVVVASVFEHLQNNPVRLAEAGSLAVLAASAIVFAVGLWDDLRPVPACVKFVFQAAAAGVAMWFGVLVDRISMFGDTAFQLGVLALPLTFLWIVGVTNAFNLVDGLDGLSAGLASIAAGTCAVIFLLRGNVEEVMLLLILLGALAGFLPYNFSPATIFLGDSGSLFIGYVLAVTAVMGSQKGATALAVVTPLLIFGLPIIDTLLSMVRRFIGGLRLIQPYKAPLKDRIRCARRMFQADQGHIHHRLIALGFSHRHAVLALYVLALGLSFLALVSVLAQYRNAGVIVMSVGLASYIGIRKLGYEEVTFLRTGRFLRWYDELKFDRRFFLGFLDMVVITAAYWGAFALKYEPVPTEEVLRWYMFAFPLVMLIQLFVFYVAGLHQRVWRAMGIGDAIRTSTAVVGAVAFSYVLLAISVPPAGLSAFLFIELLMLNALMLGVRSTYRILEYARQSQTLTGRGTLIYGAGRAGQLILQELAQNSELGMRPIGFVDDNPALRRRTVNHMPVLGASDDFASILDAHPATCLVISSRKIQSDRLQQVFRLCRERQIAVLEGRLRLTTVDIDVETGSLSRASRNASLASLELRPKGSLRQMPTRKEQRFQLPGELNKDRQLQK